MSIEDQIARALEPVIRRIIREELGQAGPDVLTTEQAAELAGVSAKTVREWIATNKLPAGRRGARRTVRREDLMRYLAGVRPEGRTAEDLAGPPPRG